VETLEPKRTWRAVVADTFLVLVVLVLLAYSAGTVWVSVKERKPDGTHLVLAVPAGLVSVALGFVPDRDLREASEQARPWLPAVEAATWELARVPDTTLVSVESASERVRVAKRGASIVVDVDDADNVVHVVVPLRLLHSVAGRLQAIAQDGAGAQAQTAELRR
jgi:hypothetical protein